jgi:demethylmenaquinone methyltransferase/2-methoxy-6-polyprenyl-1,4-benzoquinol methylase
LLLRSCPAVSLQFLPLAAFLFTFARWQGGGASGIVPRMDDRPSDSEPPQPPRAPSAAPAGTADFGYADVAAEEKPRLVSGLFSRVARRYDLMNDLMSGGLHRLWKETLVDQLRPRDAMRLVDVAGGTGDIAFRVLARAPGAFVSVSDLNLDMLAVGRNRALDRGLVHGIDWVAADAEALPFPDMSADAVTIAFGLRNVTRRERALAEMRRVLKPGGRLLCLEFSRVAVPLLGALYERYSFGVVPWIGQLVARDRDAYRYLVESIRRFPAQPELAAMMRAAGFERAAWRNLSGGIVAIHSAWRL